MGFQDSDEALKSVGRVSDVTARDAYSRRGIVLMALVWPRVDDANRLLERINHSG